MDKCTSEQFGAVASLTTADGFLVSSHKDILASTLGWFVLAIISFASLYAIWFLIQRLQGYYRNRNAMALLLLNEKDAPEFLKIPPDMQNRSSNSGIVFYIFWILAGGILCYFVI